MVRIVSVRTSLQKLYHGLLTEKTLSPKTIRNIRSVFHKTVEQAGRDTEQSADLCDLRRVRQKEIHPLEQDEIAAFRKAIEGCKHELVYRVTLFTGMRQGEILGLAWDGVDFQHNALYVNKQCRPIGPRDYRLYAGCLRAYRS